MNNELKSTFDPFEEITFFDLSDDEDFEYTDDLDLDLSDASGEKTVLD